MDRVELEELYRRYVDRMLQLIEEFEEDEEILPFDEWSRIYLSIMQIGEEPENVESDDIDTWQAPGETEGEDI